MTQHNLAGRATLIDLIVAVLVASVCCLTGPTIAHSDEPSVDDVTLLRDLRYGDGTNKHWTLDLATLKAPPERPRPAIVVIHGGGWLEGDKSSFSTTTKRMPGNILDFARLGFVAVTINYRMSGDAPFPAALDDCRSAVRWLRAHAREHHVDTDHVGAYGNSAGGHLALLLAICPQPAEHPRQGPYPDQSSQVQAAVSDSGPIDLLVQHRENQLRSVIEQFMGGPPDGARAEAYRQASPATYASDSTTFPPLLLIYGEVDTQIDVNLTDQFVAALSRAEHKDVSYIRLANVDHCPHSLIRVPYLRPIVDEFFVRTLRAVPTMPKP